MESIGVMVPAEHIAKVIGKGGAGLKQIRETTGCKLQVQPNSDPASTGARRIDVSGGPAQIAAGFQIIAAKAFPDENNIPNIFVPAESAGQIVGKGGENLRKVRELTHVRVQLERENVPNLATGLQERLLTMHGQPMQVAMALRYVLGSGAPQGGGGGGGMSMGGFLGMPVPGSFCSQIRAASADPGDVQIHFKVPDRLAGAIIGKGGEQLKQTSTQAGCRVTMTSREGGSGRFAILQGTYEACLAAEQLLSEQVVKSAQEAEMEVGEATAVYLVRKVAAGAVIGKAGAQLKEIRETSGARIQLARDEAEGQRPCQISGSLEQVLQAQKMIHDVAISAASAAATAPPPGAPAVPTTGLSGMSL